MPWYHGATAREFARYRLLRVPFVDVPRAVIRDRHARRREARAVPAQGPMQADFGVGQTFAKVFSKFAVRSRKAESRTKVAVSSWWVGTFIRPRSGRRDF